MQDTTSTTFDLLGEVYVDAGLLLIGDPCYNTVDASNEAAWSAFCERLTFNDGDQPLGEGLGLTVHCNDGIYPVFVEKDQNGRAVSVTIELDPRRFDQ